MRSTIYDAQERILLGVAEPEDYRLLHVRPITLRTILLKIAVVSFLVLTTVGLLVTAITEALQ